MNKIAQFPDQKSVADEAAQWLIRLDADTPPTQDELRALGEWLQRSPAHQQRLETLARLWGRMNIVTELVVPLGKHSRPATHNHRVNQTGQRWGPWRWTGLRAACVAASVLVAVAIGAFLQTRESEADPLLATNGLYSTAIGQQETTRLADGSEVILNTNSQIRVNYSDADRQVYLLQGEALFTVAKHAGRPFRVYAGNGRVEALGTAFSVYLKGEDVNVTVTEGRVSLASLKLAQPKTALPDTTAVQDPKTEATAAEFEEGLIESLGTLGAGQVATIRGSMAEAAVGAGSVEIIALVPPEELAARLAWREGILIFSGDRLEDVINEIGRYTTISIEIPDPAVRNMRIGGRFPVGETDAMFTVLEEHLSLRVTHVSHNRVVLSAAIE
jgi:transmembrane sensor